MKKSKLITLILFLMYGLVIYADYNQVKLISSNDDYGLEFDWIKQYKVVDMDRDYTYINLTMYDAGNNRYMCGKFSRTLLFDENISVAGRHNFDAERGLLRNYFTNEVSVLPAGLYLLQINEDKIVRFEKR